MRDLHVIGNSLFAIHRESDLYLFGQDESYQRFLRSDDGGNSWEKRRISERPGNPQLMTFDYANPDIIYVSGNEYEGESIFGVIHVSSDGGKSWEKIFTAERNKICWEIEADPVRPSTLYIGVDEAVLRSTDGGETWEEIFGIECRRLEATESGLLFGISTRRIYCSRDGGESWKTVVTTGINDRFFDVRYDASNELLYYCSKKGLFRMVFR